MKAPHESVPVPIVLALGLTQIIGYGTLYYSFSILAPDMAKDLGWPVERVFAIFSGSLLVGGLAAPFLGRYMDHFGAGRLMTIGSVVAAFTLLLCSYSTSTWAYIAAIVLLEVASGMVQYQAAFAALVEARPVAAARSITYLTLIAGFASTLFWPITSGLHQHFSWRDIYLFYAGLNLFACLPIHFWMMRSRIASRTEALDQQAIPKPLPGALPVGSRRSAFYLASIAFALQGFAMSSMLVHMVPMLTGLGLGGAAVMVSTIFGPSQVLSRFINMVFGTGLSAPMLSILSGLFIVGGIVVLLLSGGWIVGAILFAVLLGLGSGINSIVQGSLPLYLFGSDGYGELTGKMAAIRLVAGAAAPFAFAVANESLGTTASLGLTAAAGAVGLVAFESVRRVSVAAKST